MRRANATQRCAPTGRADGGWERKLAGPRGPGRPGRPRAAPPGAFTLVELLVVVSIISLLVTILMPSLGKALELTRRAVCASNLNSIGRGLMMYDTDHKGYPYVPLNGAGWGVEVGTGRQVDPGDGAVQDRSPSSCLYLLVREEFCSPGLFYCRSAHEQAQSDRATGWDFTDGGVVSYAVMNPYGPTRRFVGSVGAGVPVMADSSPYFDPTTGLRNDEDPVDLADADEETIKAGNSPNHDRAGQNVALVGGSVHWQDRADVGSGLDNIYTRADDGAETDRAGSLPQPGADGSAEDQGPAGPFDSYLVQ